MNLGEKILHARETLNLSQKDLANIIGVTEATMSRYENNKREPKGELIVKLAKALNVTTDYLLGLTNDPRNIVYSATINGDKVDLEFDKDYPHKLTPKEVEELIRKLKEAHFDVDGLIREIQAKDKC